MTTAKKLFRPANWLWLLLLVPGLAFKAPAFYQIAYTKELGICKDNLSELHTGLEQYAAYNNGSYPSKLSELTPAYLDEIPQCMADRPALRKWGLDSEQVEKKLNEDVANHRGVDTYSPSYEVSADHHHYTLYCKGSGHKDAGIPENYPQCHEGNRGVVENP